MVLNIGGLDDGPILLSLHNHITRLCEETLFAKVEAVVPSCIWSSYT